MGGLAAAAALRKQGLSVTVYEQAKQFTRLGAGIQIGCNAMHVLRGWGWKRLRAETFYPRSWNNRHFKTGEVLFDMVFGPAAEAKYGAPYLLAHRGDLHEALASIVPQDCLRLDHRLTGVDQTNAGVRLGFANGHTAEADVLIGADGVNSVVRASLFATASRASPGASPIARSFRRACWTASTSATAPNGGARTATSSCTR